MTKEEMLCPDDIRCKFSREMSNLYQREVPAYETLLELVQQVNKEILDSDTVASGKQIWAPTPSRLGEERHGAIRLGTAAELRMIRRIFSIMGMHPVGYYDLSQAGIPVHATAFRPIDQASLNKNPFRVFTSLLRLDLIGDEQLRKRAQKTLEERDIFSDRAREYVAQIEQDGGLAPKDLDEFIEEIMKTFRWHQQANVDLQFYSLLHDAHRLVADIVSFKGPHINHLTPGTLDIDAVQKLMPSHGISPKAIVEGPPLRSCPILLRQTSFKALEETVSFPSIKGGADESSHTARFGEVEQRGAALTPKGRDLYDRLLKKVRAKVTPLPDGENSGEYNQVLAEIFKEFPDNWEKIREQGLAYFSYKIVGNIDDAKTTDIESLIKAGIVVAEPLFYEDFLPVSAAGIFQSNLGEEVTQEFSVVPNRKEFERDLGTTTYEECALYAEMESQSLKAIYKILPAS